MRLLDGGTTVLVVIGVIYFIDWFSDVVNPPPDQCYMQRVENDITIGKWVDCDTIRPKE
jgi:hypothetical protein